MRNVLSRIILVGAAFAALAGSAFAQANATGASGVPGDYVILLDAEGRALAGTYWIASNVRGVSEVPAVSALPRPISYVDREFLPTRSGDPITLQNVRSSYSAAPSTLDVGQSVELVEHRRTVGRLAAEAKPSEVPFRLTMKGNAPLAIKGYDLVSHFYLKEPHGKNVWGDWGERVLIEPLGMDIPASLGRRIASLQTGTAGSTGDFFAILSELAGVALPDYTECIRRTRQTKEYKAIVARDRDLVDGQMAEFIGEDEGWWERTEAPLDDSIEYSLLDMCPPPHR